jgi:acetyltransferase-like isoleucine patch superfamily enzyme
MPGARDLTVVVGNPARVVRIDQPEAAVVV